MTAANKQYQSIFVPEHKIDLANYITEIIICNYLSMLKKPRPSSPFWRKDIAANSPDLLALSKKYQLELMGVKQLLKKFDGGVIAKYYQESRRTGFKGLKKVNQQIILAELEKRQATLFAPKENLPIILPSDAPEAIITVKPFQGKNKGKINL